MRISVIIPGYNTSNEWWTRCLKSVLVALPTDGEVICVDDGSKTKPNINVNDSRVKWLYLEKNVGQSAARNAALEIAQGEYVTFVDSDDEVCPTIYSSCLSQLAMTKADVALFGVRVVWTGINLEKSDLPHIDYTGILSDDIAEILYRRCLLEYPVNKVYRAAFLRDHSIAFPSGMCPGEDTIFNLNVIRAKAVWTVVNEVGYIYYRYDGSSLSRYLPTNLKATIARANLWKNTFSFALEECTDYENFKSEWENIWRRDSPVGFLQRLSFAREHGFSVIAMCIKMVIRRILYVRVIRSWRTKNMYPNVMKLNGGEK